MLPGSNCSPCDGGPCPPGHVFLQSGSTAGFLFCYSLIILQQSFSTDFFHHQLARKFIPDQMIPEVPSNLVLYDSMIPGGTWLILFSSFPVPLPGTQLTSVGCRTWQHTRAECHTSSSLHHIMICSSCLITPRYSLCCL